ncbi:MAG: esterase-like activity of phytase family protein [Rhodospirillales bacterium]|nr:esterase-like activity of phytase family protein [Rhodospirillales bacterium]
MKRLAILIAVLFCAPAFADPIPLQFQPIALLPDKPEVVTVGRLRYLGGLHITSKDSRFGSVSGLEAMPDGTLLGVTDTGYWLRFRPLRDAAGMLAGVRDGDLDPLRDAGGRAFDGKAWSDAEGLRRDARGDLLVSFEREHRVLRYAKPGGKGMPVDTPASLAGQPANGGIEALASWPDGRLLLLSERGRDTDGDVRAWLRDARGWHSLVYQTQGESLPTDAAVLPSGDLVVLERKFGILTELGARLALIAQSRVVPGGKLAGETLAAWEKPYSVDNMEAIAVTTEPDGGVLLWVMSDDNQSKTQRTLLMLFRVE